MLKLKIKKERAGRSKVEKKLTTALIPKRLAVILLDKKGNTR